MTGILPTSGAFRKMMVSVLSVVVSATAFFILLGEFLSLTQTENGRYLARIMAGILVLGSLRIFGGAPAERSKFFFLFLILAVVLFYHPWNP